MKHSLINSPYDIPESKEVRLLVKKGSPMDTALSASLAVNSFTEMSHLPFFINFIK
jgi:hypothetical protein